MPQVRIGVKLSNLPFPFKKALALARSMGAEAVEIDARGELNALDMSTTGIRQIRKWLADFELNVSAVSFQTRRGYDVEEDLQRRIEATKKVMTFAYELGCNSVVNQVGRVPANADGREWDIFTGALTDLGRFGQKSGAFLAMRTGTEEGKNLQNLMAALPEGSVGIDFDPGNLVVNGFSVSDALTCLRTSVLHVHVVDAVRDLAQGRGLTVPLGRGSVDFAEILGVLEESGYRGFFTIQRENSEDPVTEMNLAVSYLKNI